MLNIVVVFCGFLIAVVLARIIIPRILIISLRKRLFDRGSLSSEVSGTVDCRFYVPVGRIVHQ